MGDRVRVRLLRCPAASRPNWPPRLTHRPGRELPGHFREALGHCARRAQRHVCPAAPSGREPAGDHRAVVAYPQVIGVGVGAGAFAVTLRPASHDAPDFPHRPYGRVAGELVERLGGHRRGALCPFGGHRFGGLPGSEELPCRAVFGGTHPCIVSPGQASDQRPTSTHPHSRCAGDWHDDHHAHHQSQQGSWLRDSPAAHRSRSYRAGRCPRSAAWYPSGGPARCGLHPHRSDRRRQRRGGGRPGRRRIRAPGRPDQQRGHRGPPAGR